MSKKGKTLIEVFEEAGLLGTFPELKIEKEVTMKEDIVYHNELRFNQDGPYIVTPGTLTEASLDLDDEKVTFERISTRYWSRYNSKRKTKFYWRLPRYITALKHTFNRTSDFYLFDPEDKTLTEITKDQVAEILRPHVVKRTRKATENYIRHLVARKVEIEKDLEKARMKLNKLNGFTE